MRSALSNRPYFVQSSANSVFVKPDITRSNRTILGTIFKNSSQLRIANAANKMRIVKYDEGARKQQTALSLHNSQQGFPA
jgi:hypothetical protein